jgi:hypothetical protein
MENLGPASHVKANSKRWWRLLILVVFTVEASPKIPVKNKREFPPCFMTSFAILSD